MPRTKQMKKVVHPKESLASNEDTEAASNFEEFLNIYESKKMELLEEKNSKLAAFKLEMKQDKLSIPVSIGNKKIKDLKHGNFSLWQNLSTFSSISAVSSVLQSRDNHHPTKNLSNDEGYFTSESSTATSGGTRQTRAFKRTSSTSKSEVIAQLKKTSRPSRSLSRSKISEKSRISRNIERSSRSLSRNKCTSTSATRFKTPQNIKKMENFGTVTPKMKPNTTHVVLRRPQQGEIAISLQGSPLMTTAMVTESTANVNIPLPDGRLINIQPRKGIRPSEIPELDIDIQKQLQTLRENLDKVCQFASRKN